MKYFCIGINIKNYQSGLSFIELIITMSVISVLSAHAWTAWHQTVALYDMNQSVQSTLHLIREARLKARYSDSAWHICLSNGSSCQLTGKSWLIFEDSNKNGVFNIGENNKIWPNSRPAFIQYEGSLLNPSADFAASTGIIWPGSIRICHKNLSTSSRIIVSRMGRSRVVQETTLCS